MLQIDETTAKKLYPTANDDFKALLEEAFTKEALTQKSIIEITPTVEAALAIAGKSIIGLTRHTDSPHETAVRIIEAVIKVLWEGVAVDYSNSDQDKYEPRFSYKSGLGLSYDYYVGWISGTRCGPRLCYPSYDTMLHGIKILDTYYNDYLN